MGNFRIRSCGENATQVIDILRMLQATMGPVIVDAISDTSSLVYTTFFKDIYYAEQVLNVVTGIALGDARGVNATTKFGSTVILSDPRSPRLICVTEPNQYVLIQAAFLTYTAANALLIGNI